MRTYAEDRKAILQRLLIEQERARKRGSTMTGIHTCFDPAGGFWVVDHDARRASYAYPSSIHAVQARKTPQVVIDNTRESWDTWARTSTTIEDEMYTRGRAALDIAGVQS